MAMQAEPMSISALSVITGKDRRFVAKALAAVPHISEDDRNKKWATAPALQAIYLGDGGLDPMQERARKDKLAGDITEMKLAHMRGELLDSYEVETTWGDMLAAARAKLIQLPSTAAPRLVGLPTRKIKAILEDLVHAALAELRDHDVSLFGVPTDRWETPSDDGAAAEADS